MRLTGSKMLKVKYIPTGYVFELPETTAKTLKELFPEEYKIIKSKRRINERNR